MSNDQVLKTLYASLVSCLLGFISTGFPHN